MAGTAGGGTATDGKGGSTAGTAGGGTATGGKAGSAAASAGTTGGAARPRAGDRRQLVRWLDCQHCQDGEVLLTNAGLTIVSYGGYLNGDRFSRMELSATRAISMPPSGTPIAMCHARRALPTGAWATFEFTDYSLSADDAHNTISIGICPGDGTLHLSFDHHSNNLHYRKSVAGFVTNPTTATWPHPVSPPSPAAWWAARP